MAYEKGAILVVKAHELEDRQLTLRVVRVYRPFSYACVMSVEVLDDPSETGLTTQRAVLKLYDRRFATKLRSEHHVEPWSRFREDAFLDFVDSGEAAQLFEAMQQPDFLEEPEAAWTVAESETNLQSWCSDLFATEIEIYRHLRTLQGNQIPKIFSSVSLSIHPHIEDVARSLGDSSPLLYVRGLLMEHIVGNTFLNMPDSIPAKHWQKIFDEGLKIVHKLTELEVVNEGIDATNFIASPLDSKGTQYRVVMVGFAHCNIRQAGQSDSDWSRLKADVDEEGTIAEAMTSILRKVGFNLRYIPSNRFMEFESAG